MKIAPSAARRHIRDLARFAKAALLAKESARAYSLVAWAMVAGLLYCLWDAREFGAALIPTLFLFIILIMIALFDARYFIVPNLYALALAFLGALRDAVAGPHTLMDGLIAAALAYGGLRALAFVYVKLRGAPGLGQGDAKLLGAGGFWIGVEGLPTCLLEAALSALVAVIILNRMGNKLSARSAIPFGPHLALAIWLVWIFGPFR